jgi:hypothetical protein
MLGVGCDASILTIGEKMKANIVEAWKQQKPVKASVQANQEGRQEFETQKTESIASFSDLNEHADTEHFGSETHHGQCLSAEDIEANDAHTENEKGRLRGDANVQEMNDNIGVAQKVIDFDLACAFADERGHPGFEVWVDEECEADSR